jgi:histidinol-phosphate aminotransferase
MTIRPDLATIEPYRWQEGWEEHVPGDRPVLRLDQNTQPLAPPWYAGAAARLARVPVHTYPDSRYQPLREAIAAYTGFPAEQVIATCGADEALILCALLALSPGDHAYASNPYYGMFESATRLAGGVLGDDPEGARLHWICTPHNPTGVDRPQDAAPEREGLVVIDQAYVEFGGTDLSSLVRERDNTVVVRTLSKAFRVAGARVGFILAPPGLAATFEAIRPPGSLSSHSVALGLMALGEQEQMRESVAETVAERERMTAALRGLGWDVPESRTNFLYCDLGEPNTATVQRLLAAGVVARTFDALPNHLRITLGAPADNARVLEALGVDGGSGATPRVDGRSTRVDRRTRETQISCAVRIDGAGRSAITTGIGFLDHMLGALAFHSLIDIELQCSGDLWVDEHHTVEDVAIVLGQALDAALGDRAGIMRFGDARAPLDEALCHATVDLGGRGYSSVLLPLRGDRVGGLATSLLPHFFDSLSRSGRMAIHLDAHGGDDHHVIEAAFKALALALREAVASDERRAEALPSTKGAL